METLVKEIIDDAKIILKESLIIENKIIEDKILSIIANSKILNKELENLKENKKKSKKNKNELEKIEIEKVKRKVPLWLKKQNQYNYKILKAFMELSHNGKHSINIISLERFSSIKDPKKFLSHYNLLKTISEKNHGKVFSEKKGQVELWEPVKDIILEAFGIKES
jgi:hypothetical protein